MTSPVPATAVPQNSSNAPASNRDRSRKSNGAVGVRWSTARTSLASSAGPIPRPTGCAPSVRTISTCTPK
ncbi:hypothetical protein, partial [Serratia oryzae]|uniref:hypothetical protein n=1 Tax=Serratia oryzae TaxID=2034155 RepID=UPI001F4F7D39